MFKRKDEDIDLLSETNNMGDSSEKSEPKMSAAPIVQSSPAPAAKPATSNSAQSASPAAATPSNATTSSGYTRPTAAYRPAGDPARPASNSSRNVMSNTSKAVSSLSNDSSAKSPNGGRRVLTVGHDILLKGEIATCDRLVIEGEVDATLNEVHTVEIAETGSFKGAAEIEDAEISGNFNGELIVRGRLVIYGTGKVTGKITYGEVEIERGGEMTGTIKSYDPSKAKKSVKTGKEKAAA